MPEITTDPFTAIYQALWETAEARAGLTDLVRKGNRITLAGDDRAPLDRKVSSADFPALILVPGPWRINTHKNCSQALVDADFEWRIVTGDQRVSVELLPVMWELLRAHASWGPRVKALTWNGHPIVTAVLATAATQTMQSAETSGGIRGWVSVWTITAQCWFHRLELTATT